MALPRRLVRALRMGTYQPSSAGKRAREVARQRGEEFKGGQKRQRVTFTDVKNEVKARKHVMYRDLFNYNPRASMRAVDESDALEEMLASLEFSEDEMDEYAARASRAHRLLHDTGSAGELAIYLDYDFLWYH